MGSQSRTWLSDFHFYSKKKKNVTHAPKKKKKNAVNRNQLQNDLGDVISSDTEPVSRLLKKNW